MRSFYKQLNTLNFSTMYLYMQRLSFLFLSFLFLTATSCSETDNLIDTVNGPTASFTMPFDNCVAPCSVTFTNSSLGAQNQYVWYFGDGTTATEFEPTHQYNTPGDYNITLSATNDLGNSSVTKLLKVN